VHAQNVKVENLFTRPPAEDMRLTKAQNRGEEKKKGRQADSLGKKGRKDNADNKPGSECENTASQIEGGRAPLRKRTKTIKKRNQPSKKRESKSRSRRGGTRRKKKRVNNSLPPTKRGRAKGPETCGAIESKGPKGKTSSRGTEGKTGFGTCS